MKKLLEISGPSQCCHRKSAFISRNIVTNEETVIGYECKHPKCKHPKCTPKFLQMINKDFLPCNTKGFPRCCPLVDVMFLKLA